MEISETLSKINAISLKSEQIFLQLGNLFPSLLNRDGGTSLQTLGGMFSSFSESDNNTKTKEQEIFTNYAAKYDPLFNQLNEKIEDLKKLDKMIAEIKEDSEQMELIALNAMVISIKSGEKGQAFSRITENLQRLSNDMNLFAGKLSEEEAQLLAHINTLKDIFSGILDAQKKLSDKGSSGSADVKNLISSVSEPISTMNGFSTPLRLSAAMSTSDSVSGRGISARRSHLIMKPRKLVSPMMCCSGSRVARRATIVRSTSSSAGVSGFSKFRYKSMRFFILRP